ncbi:hypothetical protein BGZ83_010011 [Gryganskiella cystojenkinii]|nr:hypothetical protein BGZ83_010011 [Gryganskiella cystojenkinii]
MNSSRNIIDEQYQSFRIGQDGPIVRIEVLTDDETGQQVVYWEDIEFQFPGIHCVRHEDIAISLVRDAKKRRLEPWCIRYHPGVVLEVILKDSAQQPHILRPITPTFFVQSANNTSANSLLLPSPQQQQQSSPPPIPISTRPQQTVIPVISVAAESGTAAPVWAPGDHNLTTSSGSAPLASVFEPITENPMVDQFMESLANLNMDPAATTTTNTDTAAITEPLTWNSLPQSQRGGDHHQPQQELLQAIQTDNSHHAATIHQAIQDSLHTLQQDLYRTEALQREVLDRQETAAEVQARILRIQEQSLDRLALIQSQVRAVLTQTYELHEYPIPRLFIVLPVARPDQRRRDRIWKPFSESFKLYFLCECGEHTRGGGDPDGDDYTDVDDSPGQTYHSRMYNPRQSSKKQHQRQQTFPESKRPFEFSESDLDTSSSSASTHSSSTFHSTETTSTTSSWSSHYNKSQDGTGEGGSTARTIMSHHIHLAKHEGYDLERPNEFFKKYGPHLLTLLQMLKYGVMAAEIVVPPLAHWKVTEGIDRVKNGLDFANNQLEPKVDAAIQYLEALATVDFDGTRISRETESNDGTEQSAREGSQAHQRESSWQHQHETQVHALEALEGADLRHLSTFLRIKDESKVLGNLYRIVTAQGHVKWVCLDHYRSTYRESWTRPFKDLVLNQNQGQFDEIRGLVRIRLLSSTVARQFYEALERARFIQELVLALDWETSMDDLRLLRDTLQKTNVMTLRLDLCQSQGPTRDLLNRSRRFDPLLQIMTNTRVQTLTLERCDFFWSRLSKSTLLTSSTSSSSPTTSSVEAGGALATIDSPTPLVTAGSGPLIAGLPGGSIQLRSLILQGTTLSETWKSDQVRMEDLIRRCPRLIELGLSCVDIDSTFHLLQRATAGFRQIRLEVIYLSVNDSTSAGSSQASSPSSKQKTQPQEPRQEQVDILIRQPQAEISSVVIATNKPPYTELVYSGQLQKLTLCHEIDLASQEAQLRSIVLKNQKSLVEFGALCRVEELARTFDIIQESSSPCPVCSGTDITASNEYHHRHHHHQHPQYSKGEKTIPEDEHRRRSHRQHHSQFPRLHLQLQDAGGRNKLVSPAVQDPRATVLEMTSADSTGRESVLRSFGWALKKIPPGIQFTRELLKALEQGMLTRRNPLRSFPGGGKEGGAGGYRTKLQSLHADITLLDERSLDLLARVIELTEPTLQKLDIKVFREPEHRPPQTSKSKDGSIMSPTVTIVAGSQNRLIAQFILRVSSQITRLQISASGLAGLLVDLAAATTQRIATATAGSNDDVTSSPSSTFEDDDEKFITFAVGTNHPDDKPRGRIVSSTASLGRNPSVSFPLSPSLRQGSASSISRSISSVRITTATVGHHSHSQSLSVPSPSSFSPAASTTQEVHPTVSMPRLQELIIQKKADTVSSTASLSSSSLNRSLDSTTHCPVQRSHLQWLLVPLSSPSLESVHLGYLDMMKDDWSLVLWTIFQQQQQSTVFKLQKLILEGTNLSDGQVKVMLDCLDTLLASLPSRAAVAEGGQIPMIGLKEIKIEGSLVTKPVLTALETRVKAQLPDCRVIVA